MLKYTSQYQGKIKEFGNIHRLNLDQKNRWVLLGHKLPWDFFYQVYADKFSNLGTSGVNPRIMLGAVIIKHKLNLSDEETVQTISENPYMQYFLGFDEFIPQKPFSSSLFVDFRKKMGNEEFSRLSEILIKASFPEKINPDKEAPNKGKLKLDATVADQYIRYPNDLGLLNEAREHTEKLIDFLYDLLKDKLKVKPRTYRKVAREKYLKEAKKKQKNKKTLRPAIRYMLNCLDRNIRSINEMLDLLDYWPFNKTQMRQFWIIQVLNDQQRYMYSEEVNRCDDRIVSIAQPHVRPIVRGKQGKKVEFGAKIGLALSDGFVRADTLNWNAYNESTDLIKQAKTYKNIYGYYPELIQVDKIYTTNENRKWCKENNIRLTAIPKGPRKKESPYQKRKRKKEFSERNAVEGKIGQAKQGYGLNKIKAKLKNTSEGWIGAVLLITNLVRFSELNGFLF